MTEPTTAGTKVDVEPQFLDGVLVLAELLRRGATVDVLPRQVLVVTDNQGNEGSFVVGIPGDAGLSAVTFSQDKRMRRALMERAGVSIPKGATFSVGRGQKLAASFSERVGFPVMVKPAVGDNAIETAFDVMNEEELQAVLEKLMVPPEERPGFTRAAYGLTELREPGVGKDGEVTVPAGYQFLVEKQPEGRYVRFLVIDRHLVNAVLCEGRPSDRSYAGGQDVTSRVGSALREKVEKAASVIPGVPVVAVDAIVRSLGDDTDDGSPVFVEFSERPGLFVQRTFAENLAESLASRVVSSYMGASDDRTDGTQVDYSIEGHAVPDAQAALTALREAGPKLGLEFSDLVAHQLAGVVKGRVSGAAFDVARFADALLDSRVAGIPVMLAVLTPAQTP